MRLKVIVFTALLLSMLLAIYPASSTPILPSGIDNPMPVKFPELLTAPAPSWLGEGVRATYSVLSSTSDTEHGKGIDYGSGHTGNGIGELDVVALVGGTAAIHNAAYAPDFQGAMRPLISGGSASPVGCGDFWCSPDVLQKIPDQASDELTVQRISYTMQGKDIEALRLDFTPESLHIALIYDLDSGVLLYHTFDYQGANLNDQNAAESSWGNHATCQLLGLRQVKTPWKDGKMPSVISSGETLNYQGQTAIQLQGTSPTYSAMTLQLSALDAKNRYAELEMTMTDQSTGYPTTSRSKLISGISQLMGNWIPQGAAASLSPGVIDTDPYTKMQVSIVQSDADAAVFERTNQQDYREVFTYDSSGRIVQAYYEFNPDVMTQTGFGSIRTITLQLT